VKQIAFSRDALKKLTRIPVDTATLIRAKIEQYARDPKSLANNVLKLQNRPGYRLRVGDWRVIFDETKSVVTIRAVRPRGGAYD
jgi:mRNA interferase RelE/StbE